MLRLGFNSLLAIPCGVQGDLVLSFVSGSESAIAAYVDCLIQVKAQFVVREGDGDTSRMSCKATQLIHICSIRWLACK
jgi:hypothetical protein